MSGLKRFGENIVMRKMISCPDECPHVCRYTCLPLFGCRVHTAVIIEIHKGFLTGL